MIHLTGLKPVSSAALNGTAAVPTQNSRGVIPRTYGTLNQNSRFLDSHWSKRYHPHFMLKIVACLAFVVCSLAPCIAETGRDAWLRYAPLKHPSPIPYKQVVVLGNSEVIDNAREELIRGFHGLLQCDLRAVPGISGSAVVLGTAAEMRKVTGAEAKGVGLDGFALQQISVGGKPVLLVIGGDDRGVLYGVFATLRRMAFGLPLDARENPSAPIRWTNEWDNLDGSIERGYGGRSIFFSGGDVVPDLARVKEYARLLASIGINGCAINNVNASPRMLESDFISHWAKIADAFRPWGIRLVVAVDFSSPQKIGGLNSSIRWTRRSRSGGGRKRTKSTARCPTLRDLW